jgi:hypothetical protein
MKYCVQCEEKLSDEREVMRSDFCSQECADEYLSNADERVLLNARESNPDALPVIDSNVLKLSRTNSGHLARPIDGSLPPSTLEAVQSLLQIGGVSRETIDNVINIDKANNKELTPKEQEFVKNDPTNE